MIIEEQLDGYVGAELLGGGMSRVYRATRRRDGRVVAVKSVALANDDLSRAERRGAELQKLFHAIEPRVPDVCDVRTEGQQLLIEMDYVAGEDLSTVIRTRGRLAAADAVRLAAGLADVLDRAHGFTTTVDGEPYRGIIHGDLKPRNVRLEDGDESLERRLKVLDFGVAKGIRGGSDGETRNVFGSAPYMAPERLIDGTVSPGTDCWSLGVVLCEMLTGRVPFSGSERDVLLQIERGAPALPPDCPPDLGAIVGRLLARHPKERFKSAGAIRDELHRWLDATRKTTLAPSEPWVAPDLPPPIPAGGAFPGALPGAFGDATRRTSGPHTTVAPDATRRTTAPLPPMPSSYASTAVATGATGTWTPAPGVPESAPLPLPAEAAARRVQTKRRGRLPVILAVSVGLWVMWSIGREVRVWNESGLLGRRVLAAEPEALDGMWKTYGSLSEQSAFGVGTWPARGPLRLALVQHVDRVLDDFRRPEPTVREAHWKQARSWAASALELGGDQEIRARFLICDAHVKRIAGDGALRRGQLDQSRRLLNEAISQFEQAANLARRSVDPWLGLLRLYATSRRDPDNAQVALNEAVRREYGAGPREYALVGDAARDKGEDIEKGCGDLKDTDLEKKCLSGAKEQFEHALEWYQKALGYGSASRNAASAERGVRRVEARIDDLDQVPWFLRLLKRGQPASDSTPPEREKPQGPEAERPPSS